MPLPRLLNCISTTSQTHSDDIITKITHSLIFIYFFRTSLVTQVSSSRKRNGSVKILLFQLTGRTHSRRTSNRDHDSLSTKAVLWQLAYSDFRLHAGSASRADVLRARDIPSSVARGAHKVEQSLIWNRSRWEKSRYNAHNPKRVHQSMNTSRIQRNLWTLKLNSAPGHEKPSCTTGHTHRLYLGVAVCVAARMECNERRLSQRHSVAIQTIRFKHNLRRRDHRHQYRLTISDRGTFFAQRIFKVGVHARSTEWFKVCVSQFPWPMLSSCDLQNTS